MLSPKLRRDARSERIELVILCGGLATIAAAFAALLGARVFPAVLLILAMFALVGALAYRKVGHDVYLIVALVAMAIGRVVSPIVVIVMYVVAIGALGSILRIFGMNRLRRNFDQCKARSTMFVDATQPSVESFRRQS